MTGIEALLGPVGLLLLLGLPGAWLAFGIQLPALSLPGRLALSVALSPLVVSGQALALRFGGVGWTATTIALCAVNLPAGILVARALRGAARPLQPRNWLPGVLLFAILAGCLLTSWLRWPEIRELSYHGLMHTDYIYALTRSEFAPEAATLAGVPLIYFWFGHLFLTATAWAADWAPTGVYPILNLAWLAAGAVMAYELCRRLGLGRSTALVCVGLLFLATNVVGVATLALLEERRHPVFHVLGRPTYAPFLVKYEHFEIMPLGQSLLIAVAWLALTVLREKQVSTRVMLVVVLLALGLLYTPLFPIGFVWAGVLITLLALPGMPGVARYEPRELVGLIAGFAAAGLVTVLAVEVFTTGRSGTLLGISDPELVARKILWMGFAFAPMAALGLPALWRALLLRDGAYALLAFGSAGAIAMYVLIRMDPPSEYKFIFGGAVGLAPLMGVSLEAIIARSGRLASIASWLTLPILAWIFVSSAPHRRPPTWEDLPQVETESFWLALDESEPAAIWTRAIRESTPSDTVVVARHSQLHLSAFTGRASFLARTAEPGEYTAGFNQLYSRHFAYLGYPADIVEKRTALLESLYGGVDPDSFAAALRDLRSLGRPLAIHFADPGSALLAWLAHEGIGRELVRDGDQVVWFVDPENGERR
jgi:hypothetical protein